MTDEARREIVAEELALAREELAAGEQLLASGHARIAVTRAYFAVFHAMRAALTSIGVEPKTHRGTLQMFNLHFVKPGTYDANASLLAARLQKYREEADYGIAFAIGIDKARDELAAAADFVDRVVAGPTT